MKRYADDYKIVIEEDEKGREKKNAVYQGRYFKINSDAQNLIRFKRTCVLLLVLMSVMHVAGGVVGNQGMYAFYVALPYVFFFLPLYYMAVAIWRSPTKNAHIAGMKSGLRSTRSSGPVGLC